ncbi:hypothetical protein ACI1UE_10580 [Lactococcus petauri]|uniref:hypothetical protein n=1 Tax=Lactococcus petauri TaxID=1940789 RepID=UPI0002F99CB7
MAAKDRLTAKQEAFAFAVGYENKSYTEAYRDNYSTKKMTDRAIWIEASKLANHPKVSLRIDELKRLRKKELSRVITWDYKQAETVLNKVLQKNMNDLMRTEKLGQPVEKVTSSAILDTVKLLNNLYEKVSNDNSELEILKMKAEVNYLESKSKAASDSGNNQDDELKRLADSLEKLK